jgi:hypothetical protein
MADLYYCPPEKVGQQQIALRSCSENVLLCHPSLANGDTKTPLKYGNGVYLA